ncbi:MAG: DUF2845 domain-containing protein [Methylococcales bacterium]
MRLLIKVLLCSLLLVSNVAYAFKCGSNIVTKGDRKIDVLKTCGEPALVEERVEYIDRSGVSAEFHGNPSVTIDNTRYQTVVIVEWTYNFGPRRLMRLLTFKAGVLKKIEALGYGYRD